MENENSYLNINEGNVENMFNNKIKFDIKFMEQIEKTALAMIATTTMPEEMEIPDSRGQILVLISRDGVTRTSAFESHMKGNRLPTGPFEINGQKYAIFS
ncbi:MAG: hypothetical protein WAV11_03710 [Minisyncoccia bacterium]